jgi:peptide/nickel transport system substrate-binding protein
VNYTTLIEGMEKFCADFAELGADATPADLTKFIDSNELPGVVAKDDSTLVIKLVQPAAYFADMLALAAFSPAPVEVMKYKPGSAELGKHQVASGPYKIDKYDPTKTIELSRNPDWDASTDPVRKAYVDKIVIDETGDQSAIQQQLETNTKSADMAWDTFPTAQQVPGLQAKKDPNLTVSETSSSNPYIQYNFKSPNNNKAMSKLEFRQALSHAINRDNIIQVLGGKVLNEPLTHVLPPAIRGSEDTEDYYPYDADEAKSLMSKAGVSKPTLKVLYRNDSNGGTKTFETLQEDLGKVGIKVTGVPANQADFYTKYLQSPEQAGEGAFDLAIAGWGSDWYGNAAKSYFSPLFAGKPAFPPNGSNFAFYDNPDTNKLIDEASAAPDDESDALWAKADKKVMEDAAFYPITSPKTANYHAKHLHNTIPMEAFQNYDPSNVWIEKAYQD